MNKESMVYPRAMNHVGINVPDIYAAVEWYRDILGCDLLVPPGQAKYDGSHFGEVVKDIFGEPFESVLMAHLVTANGTGVELFQFEAPKAYVPENTFEYWRTGIFHICLTAPDLEKTCEDIKNNGGKVMSKIWKLHANKDYRVVYCQDPWGTVIEFASHSYEQFWSNVSEPIQFV